MDVQHTQRNLNRKNKLSFIHIPKTAGTYIRHEFGKSPYFHDMKIHGYVGREPTYCPENYTYLNTPKMVINDITRNKFYNEVDLFCVVRNPFDMLYSYYSQEHSKYSGWGACNTIHGFKSFEEFITGYCDPNLEWHRPVLKENLFGQIFKLDGTCEPKYIIRYETLTKGLAELADLYNINYKPNTPKRNESLKTKAYTEMYTSDMIDKVNIKCETELSLFGYSFDGPNDDNIFLSSFF